MTLEAKSLHAPNEKRHDAWVIGEAHRTVLDWSRSTNDAKPAR
jgi:hypothetical protein